MKKIILGTAQLGLKYGINNQGYPSDEECHQILALAGKHHLMLDTAEAYGESIRRISSFIHQSQSTFSISTKVIFSDLKDDFETYISHLLESFQTQSIDYFFYHRFIEYQNNEQAAALARLRGSGKIKKLGVSIYEIEEAREIIKRKDVDVVQLSYSLLSYKTEWDDVLGELKANGIEVHVRSIYLQGLIFKATSAVPSYLTDLLPQLIYLQKMSERTHMSRQELAFLFAQNHPAIDAIVVGVETQPQILDLLRMQNLPNEVNFQNELADWIPVKTLSYLNPAKWAMP